MNNLSPSALSWPINTHKYISASAHNDFMKTMLRPVAVLQAQISLWFRIYLNDLAVYDNLWHDEYLQHTFDFTLTDASANDHGSYRSR